MVRCKSYTAQRRCGNLITTALDFAWGHSVLSPSFVKGRLHIPAARVFVTTLKWASIWCLNTLGGKNWTGCTTVQRYWTPPKWMLDKWLRWSILRCRCFAVTKQKKKKKKVVPYIIDKKALGAMVNIQLFYSEQLSSSHTFIPKIDADPLPLLWLVSPCSDCLRSSEGSWAPRH